MPGARGRPPSPGPRLGRLVWGARLLPWGHAQSRAASSTAQSPNTLGSQRARGGPERPRLPSPQSSKVLAKRELLYVPLIGWTWYFLEIVFCKRKWEEDRDTVIQGLRRLADYPEYMWVSVCRPRRLAHGAPLPGSPAGLWGRSCLEGPSGAFPAGGSWGGGPGGADAGGC